MTGFVGERKGSSPLSLSLPKSCNFTTASVYGRPNATHARPNDIQSAVKSFKFFRFTVAGF